MPAGSVSCLTTCERGPWGVVAAGASVPDELGDGDVCALQLASRNVAARAAADTERLTRNTVDVQRRLFDHSSGNTPGRALTGKFSSANFDKANFGLRGHELVAGTKNPNRGFRSTWFYQDVTFDGHLTG